MTYRAPVDDIAHTLKNVTGFSKSAQAGHFGDLSADLVDAILEEAGRFATEEIAPLNAIGDTHGTPFEHGAVTMPPGWKELYKAWCDGGWNALTGPSEYGGQDLPILLSAAVQEMWNSGSMAFGIGPTLTVGQAEALHIHASDYLKETYLAKLVSGEWMGTMNLTEPQAGSDLNALRSKAERMDDGTYRISGQKIYITYGEHDLTENIVHTVLARLPDAPEGTRGISLFLVPKFLVNEDGTLGERNDVQCVGVEHKLGIHASPTCTMSYGDNEGAVGWLIGEENQGLRCMFTMMNNARVMVGIQGVAIAERAFQQALAYANDRRQGRSKGYSGEGMSPIVEHPDVQRSLLTMKSLTRAARSITYSCAYAIDMSKAVTGDEAKFWAERANLLTPVAKAFSTDIGVEVASMGVQVHGGMGFIEETGAARNLRDARIAPIYEGTNGIQAIDLVMRKVPQSGGSCVSAYFDDLQTIIEGVRTSNRAGFDGVGDALCDALEDLRSTSDWILQKHATGETEQILAGATPYLRLFGLASGSIYLAQAALQIPDESDQDVVAAHIAVVQHAAAALCAQTAGLRKDIGTGGASLSSITPAILAS